MPDSNYYFEPRLKGVDADLDRDLVMVAHPAGGISDERVMTLRELSSAFAFMASGTNVSAGVGAMAKNNPALGGLHNVAIGAASMANNVSGESNVALGAYTMTSLVSGSTNVAIGQGALGDCAPDSWGNVAIGVQVMLHTTGPLNTGVGRNAFLQLRAGGYNVGVGNEVGFSLQAGSHNIMLGNQAGYSGNGNGNIYIGNSAGFHVTTGINNIALGQSSGQGVNFSETIAIGTGAVAPANNTAVIGPVAMTDIYFGSSAAPNAKIHAKQARFTALPTAVTGLPTGTLWNNAGIVNIAP